MRPLLSRWRFDPTQQGSRAVIGQIARRDALPRISALSICDGALR
jgi:hypothetical protein